MGGELQVRRSKCVAFDRMKCGDAKHHRLDVSIRRMVACGCVGHSSGTQPHGSCAATLGLGPSRINNPLSGMPRGIATPCICCRPMFTSLCCSDPGPGSMSHVTPGKAQPKLTSFFSSPRTATPSPGSGTAPAPQRSLLPEPDGTPPKSLLPDFGTASKSLLPGAETPKRPRDPVPALVSSPGGTPETEVDSPTSKRAKPDPEAPPAALPEPHRAAPTARPPQPPVTAAPTPQPPATRRFVPAPLNASGLLPGEAAAQRGQQLAKEKKEIRYSWLADPRDQQGCRPGDPGYDPRRLYVPPTVLANMTDFERQYWEIKKDNWDVVVFFKKGKFYELYEVLRRHRVGWRWG